MVSCLSQLHTQQNHFSIHITRFRIFLTSIYFQFLLNFSWYCLRRVFLCCYLDLFLSYHICVKFKQLLNFGLNTYLKFYLICAYPFPVTSKCETCIVSCMNGKYLFGQVTELQRFRWLRIINIRINKRPTNASEKPMYYHINSLLHFSALQRRHLQGVQYELAELLPNVVKANWDEGWKLWPSVTDAFVGLLFIIWECTVRIQNKY
jgi:hypothetical protein